MGSRSESDSSESRSSPSAQTQSRLCYKCQHHGVMVPVKSHSRVCPYLFCHCANCDRFRRLREIDNQRRQIVRNRQRAKQRAPECKAVSAVSPSSSAAQFSGSGALAAESGNLEGSVAESGFLENTLRSGGNGTAAQPEVPKSADQLSASISAVALGLASTSVSPSESLPAPAASLPSMPCDPSPISEWPPPNAGAPDPSLRISLVPTEVGLDFDPLLMAELFNRLRYHHSVESLQIFKNSQ